MKRLCLFILICCTTINSFCQTTLQELEAQQRRTDLLATMKGHALDTIPIIVYNEKEITFEDYLKIPSSKIRTAKYMSGEVAKDFYGDRGEKREVIHLSSRENYFPNSPNDGNYYTDGDLPAVFPEGEDSLKRYIKAHTVVPNELNGVVGDVYVNCFIDSTGKCEKAEVSKIHLYVPQAIEIHYLNGKRAETDIISKSYWKRIDMMRDIALNSLKDLPQFIPATFYLQHVKYLKELRVTIVSADKGNNIPDYVY